MIEFIYLFGLLSVCMSIMQTFWLIDLLICVVFGILFTFVFIYGVSGTLIFVVLVLVYVGVILLLIFLVGFLLDVSVDRNNQTMSDSFMLFLFISGVFVFSESNFGWSFISSNSWNYEYMESYSSLETSFLWISIFLLGVFDMMLVGLLLFSVLLGVLVALNIRIY